MPLICDLDLQIADETRLSKRVVYQVIECERGLCILVQGDPRNHSLTWNYWCDSTGTVGPYYATQ